MSAYIQRRKSEGGRRNGLTQEAASLRPAPGAPRAAFTLVEMLVVISIIGVLVSLASVAVFKALETAKWARIKMEATNLGNAIEAFKQKYGDYPPSYLIGSPTAPASRPALQRFLAKAFPRCDIATEMKAIPSMSGDQALVFWLTSISKDSAHPFSAVTTDRQSLFDFDKTRFNPSAGGWTISGSGPSATAVYTPQVYCPASGKQVQFFYFEARDYLLHALYSASTLPPNFNSPFPYLQDLSASGATSYPWDKNGNGKLDVGSSNNDIPTDNSNNLTSDSFTTFQSVCANPKSFQIISAGLDGQFGPANVSSPPSAKYKSTTVYIFYKSYPSGLGYDTGGGDDDNATNFSEKKLGDAKP
jgi:prepilin-type N-terminal cleavage/methylation domain-containing protein